MSRAQLLDAARSLGIRVDPVIGGRRVPKSNETLRWDITERCYGPGLDWKFKTAAEADAVCARIAAVCRGELGYGLSISQYFLKQGNDELAEYRRLGTLKKRRPTDEARLLRSARQWLDMADIAQRLHELEAAVGAR